jgi:hypothetical protein
MAASKRLHPLSQRLPGSWTRKRTKTAVAAVALVALGLVAPTAASADTLSMYYARDRAMDTWWVDTCYRYSPHKTSCDANVQGTTFGDVHCGYSSCHSTDTTRTCWRRVWAILSPHNQPWRVRYVSSYAHCRTSSDTSYY